MQCASGHAHTLNTMLTPKHMPTVTMPLTLTSTVIVTGTLALTLTQALALPYKINRLPCLPKPRSSEERFMISASSMSYPE